jgi:hypothetical protein
MKSRPPHQESATPPLRKGLLAFVLCCSAVVGGQAVASQLCVNKLKVTRVGTGHVSLPYGADNGNAIYFTLENGKTFPINYFYNLNDQVGPALHRVLLLALQGGFRISAWDHSGWMCDDIDEVWIDG